VNDSLKHITLNSGHVRDSPRSEVADEVLDAVRLLVVKTGSFDVPGQPGWRTNLTLDQGAAVFDVRQGNAPIVMCAVAWSTKNAEEVWAVLARMATQFGTPKPPSMPAAVPWIGVLLLPTAVGAQEAMDWLGDYERCLAWAILEEHSGSITG
jgi:hypothetical protein